MTEEVWLVKHKLSLEQVLTMIRDRDNPDAYIAKSYWFKDRSEAEHFMLAQILKTGDTYTLVHRDDCKDSLSHRVSKLLRNNND